MFTEKDTRGKYIITDMTVAEAEVVSVAVTRIIDDLPTRLQHQFRRLLIDLDHILPRQNDMP